MLLKCGTGNSKDRPSKYSCPFCGQNLKIVKRHSMTLCSNKSCGKIINGDELVEIKKEE